MLWFSVNLPVLWFSVNLPVLRFSVNLPVLWFSVNLPVLWFSVKFQTDLELHTVAGLRGEGGVIKRAPHSLTEVKLLGGEGHLGEEVDYGAGPQHDGLVRSIRSHRHIWISIAIQIQSSG